MRITFFFENYEIGGGSKYVKDCINLTLQLSNQLTLLSNQDALSKGELAQLIKPIDIQLVHVFERAHSVAYYFGTCKFASLLRKSLVIFTPFFFLLNIVVIWWHLGKIQCKLVIAFNGGYPASEPALAAVLAARLRNLTCMLFIMSTPKPRRNILPGYSRLLDFLVFRASDLVVLNSFEQSRSLVKLRGMPIERIRVLYNGIPDVHSERNVMPLTRSTVTLGVACRLDPMKGLDHLIRAIPLLPACIELRIIGDGESCNQLQKLAQVLGISDRITFVGYKQDGELLDELDDLDIYVFPSLWEGLPYSLLEAMRAGLPIIATNVGGIPEALGEGEAGLLVPPASPQALANAVNILLCDRELARHLGASARERYRNIFSLAKMQDSFSQVIAAAQLNNQRRLDKK